MRKNAASQLVSAQMVSASDGSNVTSGTCNVAVEIDGTAGTGGTATHIANGKWEYAPIQADTNGDYLTFQFVLSGAITQLVQIYTTFPQTGDNFARLGAPAGASVSADVAAVKAETASILTDTAEIGAAGAGLTALPWNAAWDAEVQSECTDALNAYDPPTKTEMDSAFTEVKGATWSSSTDTLEAIRNRGDAAWVTATGFSTLDAAGVRTAVGLGSANLDTQLADLPTVAEFEARTIAAASYFDPATDRVLLDKADALRVTGSVNDGSASTTVFVTDLTEATDDHYIGRTVIFTSGALTGQASDITDYNGTTKAITVTALTEAPANGVTFEIV